MRFKPLLAAGLLALAPIAQAADPQPYVVHTQSTGNGALNATIRASSQLESLRTAAPVGPFALVGRAQQDIERLQTVLNSFGYYRDEVAVTINGLALDDPHLPDVIAALPNTQPAKVEVHISTGPLFHLRKVEVQGAVSAGALKAFALHSGAPAIASEVLAARERLLNALQEEGHAYAVVEEPIAYEDASEPVLDVSFKVDPGSIYQLGEIRVEGLKRVHEAFVRRQLTVHPGERYNPLAIERVRTTLLGMGVFSSVTVRLPPHAQVPDERLPITFVVVERLRHVVNLNAAYSSDLGGSAGATWTNRNTFGNAEQLSISASVIDVGGTATNGVGYQSSAQLIKPDFMHVDQSLQFGLVALRQYLIAYDQASATATTTLTRKLSAAWSASVGVSLEQEQVLQQQLYDCMDAETLKQGEEVAAGTLALPVTWCHYTLLAFPVSARYDSTALTNPLNDPLHGMRFSLSISPTTSLLGSTHPTFTIFQATASTYFDFARLHWSRPGWSVLALRGFVAEARGASQFSLPPDQRLYGGGSATVRGYAYQAIGPEFPDGNPTGGTALAAGSVELRQRVHGNFGMAAFVDAGEVTAGPVPLQGTRNLGYCSRSGVISPFTQPPLSVGYGAGIRYYTPVGPIRVDAAFPAEREPCADAFEVYVGLGQAF